jgi:hypothetical protein
LSRACLGKKIIFTFKTAAQKVPISYLAVEPLTVAKTLSGFPIELELPGTTREPEMYPVACKKTPLAFLRAAFPMVVPSLSW